MIPVTQPYVPPIERYKDLIEGIWERKWLTNDGPLVQNLEKNMIEFTGSKHFYFLNNGTIALQIAIKALDLKGEIITTPFSYVATTSSIVWENCTPVFADIDTESWNISVKSIEKAITAKTTAILATHIYGNACDVEAIEQIAQKHKLKVIYDAAHCFGSKYRGQALFNFGDVATASFHATKLFHTVEGGGVFTQNQEIAHKLSYMRNFGHNGQEAFWGLGINGKNSEFHAAMGLAIWPDVNALLEKRKAIANAYHSILKPLIDSGVIKIPEIIDGCETNYSYIPILLPSEKHLLRLRDVLNAAYIYPRRYFYPSLTALPYVNESDCPVAVDYSGRVFCLPSYFNLQLSDAEKVANLIVTFFAKAQ